jgi:hypothetical protein
VLGDLSPEEAERLEALLKLRPELHRELQALQRALETAYGVEEKQPPPALRASLLQAHAEQAAQPMRTPALDCQGIPSLATGAWGRWPAGLIVALGLGNLYLWRRLQLAQTQGIPGEVLTYELQPTAENLAGSVKLEVDPPSACKGDWWPKGCRLCRKAGSMPCGWCWKPEAPLYHR